MEKVRIYELAKELNTTSKRLIEKLAEIDISVKNHMSFIEKHEVDALYKHIGVISHDGEKKGDDLKDISSFTPHTRTEQKTHDKKDIPRIIRTTEITSSTSLSDKQKEKSDSFKDKDNNKYRDNENRRRSSSHQGTKSKNGYRSGKSYGGVKVSVASSGLRAGFVRETDSISIAQQILSKKSSVTQRDEEIKKSADKDNKNVIDSKDIQTDAAEAKANIKQETKTEQKTENKIDIMSSKK
ncbi:MAG: hypothetical protein GYA02_15090, partial [Clostridiaceae bacterium]|nr:hypothetical protein [Clostridiaceae bacterium]